jgi:hypothetical protein
MKVGFNAINVNAGIIIRVSQDAAANAMITHLRLVVVVWIAGRLANKSIIGLKSLFDASNPFHF